jgi:poly-beta-1,6-N-acetyl-D-glucosamine synthase
MCDRMASTSGRSSKPPRRSRSASCRSTRARPRRPLHPDRSVLPVVEGQAERLRGALHRAGRPHQRRCRTTWWTRSPRRSTRSARRSTARMLVAGVAYKRDIDDMRESPALDVMGLLHAKGATVAYADPFVPEVHGRDWPGGFDLRAVDLTRGTLGQYDCVVIAHRPQGVRLRGHRRGGGRSSSTRATRSRRRTRTCSSSARRGRTRPRTSPSPESRANVMESLFWISAAAIGYVYAGYPLLLAAWARLAPRPARARRRTRPVTGLRDFHRRRGAQRSGAGCPRGSNLLTIAYPGPARSWSPPTDRRTAPPPRWRRLATPSRLLELPPGGKPLALNAAVAASRGEILVFADARQSSRHDALKALVRNFDDPLVGGVTGELVSRRRGRPGRGLVVGEGRRAVLELREVAAPPREPDLVDARGHGRHLRAATRHWRPLPAETLLDDVLAPMRAVLGGAAGRVRRAGTGVRSAVSRRRGRVAAKGGRSRATTRSSAQEPRLLLPWRNPVWIQYVSHKVGRLVVPWALAGAFFASAALAGRAGSTRGHSESRWPSTAWRPWAPGSSIAAVLRHGRDGDRAGREGTR